MRLMSSHTQRSPTHQPCMRPALLATLRTRNFVGTLASTSSPSPSRLLSLSMTGPIPHHQQYLVAIIIPVPSFSSRPCLPSTYGVLPRTNRAFPHTSCSFLKRRPCLPSAMGIHRTFLTTVVPSLHPDRAVLLSGHTFLHLRSHFPHITVSLPSLGTAHS